MSLNRDGDDLAGTCPFHGGPGLRVTAHTNRWACSVCAVEGGPVQWVMKTDGVSERHALDLLRSGKALAPPQPARGGRRRSKAGPVSTSTVRRLPSPVNVSADDQRALQQVVAFYHSTLKDDPEALAFLQAEGLVHGELVEALQLGYANRTLGYRLPLKNRHAGAEVRAKLQRVGILRESGHEHLRGCITVPVLDENGLVVQVYGVRMGRVPGSPDLCLPSPSTVLWNAAALHASRSIILAASVWDGLFFWAAGHRNVVATVGGAFGATHAAQLTAAGVERVLVATEEAESGLEQAGISATHLSLPDSTSVPEFVRRSGLSALAALVNDAVAAVDPRRPAQQATGATTSAPPEPDPSPVDSSAHIASQRGLSTTDEVALEYADRRYRVRGLAKNTSHDQLRVNIFASRPTMATAQSAFHVDTLDLYAAKQRAAFIKQAAVELGVAEEVIRHDLARVLFRLEELQDANIRAALEPSATPTVEMTDEEISSATELLRAPDLLERILRDFERCGVVGEETNKLVAYLAATSRKLDDPLAVIIQSSSAAGKTSLMEAVLAFVPPEERVQFSALTGQSLFYLRPDELRHKVLAVAEEEGAHRAAYALKLLQSEGALTIGSTAKDPGTGRLVTQQYRVEGPVAIFTSTTAVDIDPELLNRCIVLSVDEDREQTRAIHRLQRERQTLEGILARHQREATLKLHQNAQRLLRSLVVVNPYAPKLTFLDDRTRTRRDHLKYLGLIRAIALLHQHQRKVKSTRCGSTTVEYIEATLEDIATANRLADKVLGRSLDDLPPHTRKLLVLLDEMVTATCAQHALLRADYRFTRRQVREHTGWGDTQVFVHLKRLQRLEYVAAHRAERGHGFVYELLYDGRGRDGAAFLAGLLDVERLGEQQYDADHSGAQAQHSAPIRPSFGADSGTIRTSPDARNPSDDLSLADSTEGDRAHTHHRGVSNGQRTDAPVPPGDVP